MLPITRTNRADEDLIDIWLSIAADDPADADRVLDAIGQRWRQLSFHPESGPARDDVATGIRHLRTGRYLTIYRVEDDRILIVRVLHERRIIDRHAIEP